MVTYSLVVKIQKFKYFLYLSNSMQYKISYAATVKATGLALIVASALAAGCTTSQQKYSHSTQPYTLTTNTAQRACTPQKQLQKPAQKKEKAHIMPVEFLGDLLGAIFSAF